MDLPIRLASSSVAQLFTTTSMVCLAPSAPATILRQSEMHTSLRVLWNSSRSTGKIPLERSATVSLVDVSVSTLMLLNDRFTLCRRTPSIRSSGTMASVNMYTSMVAMLGSIIPAPFAVARIVASPTLRDSVLIAVSVVMIPFANCMKCSEDS